MAQPKRKSVAIVAMGASNIDYIARVASAGGRHAVFDEVWAINAMGGVIDCDRVIMMDGPADLMRRSRHEAPFAGYPDWWRTTRAPIYTSHPDRSRCPTSVAYPIERVLERLPFDYLNNTVAYAVALAIVEEAAIVTLYGCDFSYENRHQAEKGRANVEFLLGFAIAHGMQVHTGSNSTLLDSNCPTKFYGYEGRVRRDDTGAFVVDPVEPEAATDGSITETEADGADIPRLSVVG